MAPPLRLNETCSTRRRLPVSDGQGGWTTKMVDHLSGVPCRVRPWLSEEQLIARQPGIRISHVMYVHGGDFRRGDEVTVRGMVADVQAVREPSETGHHLMVDLEERQAGSKSAVKMEEPEESS